MRTTGAAAAVGSLLGLCLAVVTILGAGDAMANEEAKYTVVTMDGAFEIRDYAPHVRQHGALLNPSEIDQYPAAAARTSGHRR